MKVEFLKDIGPFKAGEFADFIKPKTITLYHVQYITDDDWVTKDRLFDGLPVIEKKEVQPEGFVVQKGDKKLSDWHLNLFIGLNPISSVLKKV